MNDSPIPLDQTSRVRPEQPVRERTNLFVVNVGYRTLITVVIISTPSFDTVGKYFQCNVTKVNLPYIDITGFWGARPRVSFEACFLP